MNRFVLVLIAICIISCVNSLYINSGRRPKGDVLVNITSLGEVAGSTSQTFFTGRETYNFLGINYAISPSTYRFQPPQKYPAWGGIYNATRMRQRCPQMEMAYYPPLDPNFVDQKDDIEDCLVVNVYTPKIRRYPEESLLPVLIYVHGGSFIAGSAYDFLPSFLLEKDIVLVVLQYRLGVFGFLSLQTDSIPGNVGLMDIVLAHEWVQDNIANFGGDPKRVTTMGQSAGAAAVSSLLISPMVRPGLFHQMIIHSGSILASWALNNDPVPSTKFIAKNANCYSDDDQEIADCLRKAPVADLIKAHEKYMATLTTEVTNIACSPVIQRAGGSKKYLVELPQVTFAKGNFHKIPILGGFTRDEGSSFVPPIYELKRNETPFYFDRNISVDLVKIFGIEDKTSFFTDFYQNKYFDNINDIVQASPALIDLLGTYLIKSPTTEIVRSMSYHKPSYLYSFNFLGKVSKLAASDTNWTSEYPFPTGVAHSDDLGYLFPDERFNYSAAELKMVTTMVGLWSSFIITGKPAPEKVWRSMKSEYGPYYRIDKMPKQYENVFKEFEVSQREGYAKGKSSLVLPTILSFLLPFIAFHV